MAFELVEIKGGKGFVTCKQMLCMWKETDSEPTSDKWHTIWMKVRVRVDEKDIKDEKVKRQRIC